MPEGFLLCDGKAYLRNEYPELFAAIGTYYGSGNGVSTFNVPNLQTRVPVGKGEGYELGDVGGEATHTLTVNEMPSHSHVTAKGGILTNDQGTEFGQYATYQSEASITAGKYWTADTLKTGSSQSHNNMQPYTVVNYIIATGKDTGVSVQDIIAGVQALPLGVEYGGTGATNIEDALNNLGAVSKSQVVNNFTTTEAGFVADARALKTLLEKINEAMTVHRVDITPQNGQNYMSYGGTYYQYTQNMLNVHVGVSGLSTEFKTLFQLPTQFWPKTNVTMILGAGSLNKKSQVIINSSGTVSALSEDGYCFGDVFYFYDVEG